MAEVTDARDWQRRRELTDEAALADGLEDALSLDVVVSCYHSDPARETAERLAEAAWACEAAEPMGDPCLHFRACYDGPRLYGDG